MPKQKSTHVDDPAAVGKRLRDARERSGVSQRELAFPGCSAAYISRIEAGARIPSLQLLRELGRRLGVTEDYLATGSERTPAGERAQALVEAEVALRLDDLELAERLYRDALAGASAGHERAHVLAGLGQLAFRRSDPLGAIEQLDEALRLLGDAAAGYPGYADTLGRAYAIAGEFETAIGLFERWLESAVRRDDLLERVRFSVLLANALIDAGRFGHAEEILGGTLALVHDHADPILRARLYWSQSRLHTMQGNSEAASRYARRALEILEQTEHTSYTAQAHHLLAYVELDRGRAVEALDLLRRGRLLLSGAGTTLDQARFRLEEARALSQLGRREEAASLAMETAGLLVDVDPYEAGRGYCVLAEIWKDLDDPERAVELYELAVELLEATPSRYLVDAYGRLAELLEAQGRQDEALAVLKKAVSTQAEAGRLLR